MKNLCCVSYKGEQRSTPVPTAMGTLSKGGRYQQNWAATVKSEERRPSPWAQVSSASAGSE